MAAIIAKYMLMDITSMFKGRLTSRLRAMAFVGSLVRVLSVALLTVQLPVSGAAQSLTEPQGLSYIHPEIGGVGRLLEPTRPTFQRPGQLLRMTPMRKDYLDDQISSFPLLVPSHRLGQVFSMMPTRAAHLSIESWDKKAFYDQGLEQRKPWHYSTYFLDEDIQVEFAPGEKAGMFRIVFPKGASRQLLLGAYNGGENWWHFDGGTSFTAMQLFPAEAGMPPVKVFLYGKYNQVAKNGTIKNGQLVYTNNIQGEAVKAFSLFDMAGSDTVLFRYAVSYIDEAQARRNFEKEFQHDEDFAQFAAAAKNSWAEVIRQIDVEGGTEAEKRSFYTALYRCYERMVNISEQGRYYSGYDHKVHQDPRPFYVDDWAWDTYLALHPLRTILRPKMQADMLASYVRMYEQSGWMPTFPVVYGDHACMNGLHSSIMMLDAYRKGIRDFDVKKAYEGMLKNATRATLIPWRNGPKTELDDFYYAHGYFPALAKGQAEFVPLVDSFEKRQAVAVTLGASYDDWAVGQMAAELGKYSDTALFAQRAKNYKNLWHPEKQFFLPRDDQGSWVDIDPKFDGGMGGRAYYDENNGWTYLWQVQQDIPGLISLMGGKQGFESRLDQLFREGLERTKYELWAKFPDASGLVGQFSMGNEPSFVIPYLYNYTNAPWKTQNKIRLLLKSWFGDDIFGIPGDEDGGGMSAFIVFSMMGFYPVVPGTPVYTIGSPVFSKVSIQLPNGKVFKLIADGASEQNKYIQSATLNGQSLHTAFFTHEDLVNGGVLELKMGPRPNKSWGWMK